MLSTSAFVIVCLTIVYPLLHLQTSLAGFLLVVWLGTKQPSMLQAVSGQL